MSKQMKVAPGKKGRGPNEFFRGDEIGYEGGDKTIDSPCGSIFNAVSKLSTNALDRGIAEQGGGGNGDTARGRGRRIK